jgi:hypothetical protein
MHRACLLGTGKGDGPDTPVAHEWRFLRSLPLRVLPAAPEPPPESLPRTLGVSLPSVHLLHECIINLMGT